MEGTCGKIDIKGNTVNKKIKSDYKGKCALEQFHLQKFAYDISVYYNFKVIKVPKVIDVSNNYYVMEKIDDSTILGRNYLNDKKYIHDLEIFYREFIKIGYFPHDYECYLQKDGKIAIIDFDKFLDIRNEKLYYQNSEYKVKDILGSYNIPEKFMPKLWFKH